MVSFCFYDDSGTLIRNIDESFDLSDKVTSITIDGPFDKNRSNCRFLTSMLKSSPKRLEKITIGGDLTTESPEFLAFLVLLCNKTNYLEVSECLLLTNACTCLMSTLLTHDGIRHFKFMSDEFPLPTNEAKILLEGVASSPCLECFSLKVSGFGDNRDVGTYLIQALRRNQSLKTITLFAAPFEPTVLPEILKASVLGPNVRVLSIVGSDHGLKLDDLQEVLRHKNCTLKKLSLCRIPIITGTGFNRGSIIQNSSVTSLTLIGAASTDQQVDVIISIFKSLVELDLSYNHITRLSFLDPLLFGETSQLQSLAVKGNLINEAEMESFIEKLRQIRGLKHLAIGEDRWEDSDSANTALIDALRHNTDIEHVDFFYGDLPLDLNRGGRRIFESSYQPFPTNLLPLVLERASKISYYKPGDDWGSPTNEEARVDVVFWMLHRIVPQL